MTDTILKQAAETHAFHQAVRFFHEHAGYVVGEKIRGAIQLARAERDAKERGWNVFWDNSPERCSCVSDGCAETPHDECLDACLYAPEQLEHGFPKRRAVPLAVLGSICGADRDYRRVIEAELYLEALYEMRKIDRWEDPTV